MVQRARLAVVILLVLAAISFQYGQEVPEFTPPRLLSEPVLDLPADYVDPPNDVLILVEIKPDSTASLVRIMDGKENLKPNVEELLPYLLFVPSFQKGIPVTSTLSIKLRIRQIVAGGKEVSQNTKKEVADPDLKDIYPNLRDKLIQSNLQTMITNNITYNTNFFREGLNNRSELILKDGFIQSPSLYNNSLQHQMMSAFRELDNWHHNPITVDYKESKPDWVAGILKVRGQRSEYSDSGDTYPWSATLTDIYAGLGDYEYNFAKGQVMKNHLFGVQGFYTELGFLFQNGWWQETISSQTSGRLYVTAPYKGTRLTFNYESYDQDIPSTSLLPGLQNDNLFTIAQKRNELYLKWALPWFTAGWQNGKEKLRAPGILIPQDYETGQFLLHRSINLFDTDFNLSYQYNYKNTIPEVQSLYQYNHKPEHQGMIRTKYRHLVFSNINQALISEKGLDLLNVQLGYAMSPNLATGFKYIFFNGQDGSYSDEGLYDNSDPDHSPSTFITRTFSTNLEWLLSESVDIKLEAGSRIYVTDTYDPVQSRDLHNEIDRPFAEMKFKVERDIFKLKASYEQNLQWTQYHKGLIELPELQGQARFKLVRDMGHNNALSAGLNLTGHSDYIKANSSTTPVYGSLIADAWLGVKITDLFEFQLILKNIGDNNIFGVYPHPRAIMSTIHWFFLN